MPNLNKLSEEEKKDYLESISFSNLVKAIDEKWSHTYIDPPPEEDLEPLEKFLDSQN